MVQKLFKAARYLQNRGMVNSLREARHRWYTWHYERKFNVETRGWVDPEDLGHTSKDSKPYGPGGYEHMFFAYDRIPFSPSQVELVDYGAGRGRAIFAAASRPYRKVVGVELAPSLCEDMRRNLSRMGGRCQAPVEIWEGDATQYPISPTANVFYFFNPFEGQTLARVAANIRESLEQHPRPAFVIYYNSGFWEQAIAGQNWIKRVYHGRFYPNYECSLYMAGTAVSAARPIR